MTIISKVVCGLVGVAAGGSSVYYGLTTLHGYPISKWDSNWDKRQPDALVKPEASSDLAKQNEYNEKVSQRVSKATRHYILIRHGQYNLAGESDEQRYLTELGEKQASLTGQRLKELDFPYTNIIRSTMTRAQQTGKLIAKHLPDVPIQDSQLLTEGAPCLPEPMHSSWRPDLKVFQDGPRIEAAFRKFIHRAPPQQTNDSYDIIVCHANVIRYIICRALQLPPNAWLRFSLNHASITWLTVYPNGKVAMKQYSDVGHMNRDSITTS